MLNYSLRKLLRKEMFYMYIQGVPKESFLKVIKKKNKGGVY